MGSEAGMPVTRYSVGAIARAMRCTADAARHGRVLDVASGRRDACCPVGRLGVSFLGVLPANEVGMRSAVMTIGSNRLTRTPARGAAGVRLFAWSADGYGSIVQRIRERSSSLTVRRGRSLVRWALRRASAAIHTATPQSDQALLPAAPARPRRESPRRRRTQMPPAPTTDRRRCST